MNAIPTKYAGVQFRSRLEARWAAFFDLLAFPWKYEPFDCAGYIPDFLLFDRMLVEVKPIVWGRPRHGQEPGAAEAMRKLERAFDDKRFAFLALVGVGVYVPHEGEALFGRAAETHGPSSEWKWSDLSLQLWQSNGELSFLGQPTLGIRSDSWPDISSYWHEAGNIVQWRAPRTTHAIPRHVDPAPFVDDAPGHKNWLSNSRSWNSESPEAFCDHCGYPIGHEHPGCGTPDTGFVHINAVQCLAFRDGNASTAATFTEAEAR